MILDTNDRPLLKDRIVKDITLMLEDEYRGYILERGKSKFVQSESENKLELLYSLFVAHIDNFVKSNTYVSGALIYIHLLKNNQTITNLYKYFDVDSNDLEKYAVSYLKELYSYC